MAGSQQEIYTIFCLIVGEDVPFPVKIANNETVGYLKKVIKDENHKTFANIEAHKLKLHYVEIPRGADWVKAANEKVSEKEPPLDPLDELADIFKGTPTKSTIHIIVEPPEAAPITANLKRKASSDLEDPDKPLRKRNPRHSGPKTIVQNPEWCPRDDTVTGILNLLHQHHVIQVRGTPASGKSTLMYLLHGRILTERPNAKVFIQKSWPKHVLASRDETERLSKALPGYPNFGDEEQYFLFDEGQSSYWDTSLWTVLKDLVQSNTKSTYAILFCSYGNETLPGADTEVITPLHFGDAKVTLDRVSKSGSKPYGLLLDEEEFRDVIQRRSPLFLADDLRDFVYHFTRGHAGATVAVISFLMKKRRHSMEEGIPYSLEDFQQDTLSYDEFCTHLSMDHGIARGLPSQEVVPSYGSAMRDLLFHELIDRNNKDIAEDIQLKLMMGYKWGFVNLDENAWYAFASPLHQQLWSWRLLPQTNYQIPFQNLFSFVKTAIFRFRPSQLTVSDRRVGSPSHRPPEAQYQEEYYRCVHELTRGNVRISPEYAAAAGSRAGRIDFFIPSKKWGIELTRDGLKLGEHDSRFADDGAYGQWLQSSDMDDYVLLDFRSTMPVKGHPGIRNLYHVVFSHDKTQVEIYDNHLSLQEQRNLMQNHR